jgi:hypothetical protein
MVFLPTVSLGFYDSNLIWMSLMSMLLSLYVMPLVNFNMCWCNAWIIVGLIFNPRASLSGRRIHLSYCVINRYK